MDILQTNLAARAGLEKMEAIRKLRKLFQVIDTVDTVISDNTYHQIITESSPDIWLYEGMQSYMLTHHAECPDRI